MTAQQILEQYQNRLKSQGLSPATIERKLSSIKTYLEFLEQHEISPKSLKAVRKKLGEDKGALTERELKNKLAELGIKTESQPSTWSQLLIARLLAKFWRKLKSAVTGVKSWRYTIPYLIKYGQPKWFIRYNKLSFSRYLNFAVLIIFCVALGISGYEQFIKKPPKEGKILGTAPVLPPKYLSFQGRLTDSAGTPITTASHFRFSIYNDSIASGSAKLYEEAKWVQPDQDGIFNTLIGDATTLDQTIFQNNTGLWLGVTVGTNAEMTDRQQIATVAYAFNSQYLQGYGVGATDIGANVNEIPVIDSQGRLMIAAAGPSLKTTSGTFRINSPVLALMADTGNGNIGIGISNPGSKLSIGGGVGIGTSSIASAYISSRAPDGGLIIEGNVGLGTTSPASGYKLDVIGNLRTSGNINIGGSASITSIVNLANLSASRPIKTNANNDLITSQIDLSSTNDITGVLALANGGTNRNITASHGAVVYSDASSLNLTGVGSSGQVLMSNGATAPGWATLSIGSLGGISGSGTANYLTKWQTAGSTIINSQLLDDGTNVGIGTSTLGTAKFSVMGGNVGIGTTSPGQRLDVTGNINTSGTGIFTTTKVGGLQDTANSLGSTGNLLVSTGTGVSWVPTTSLSIGNADTVDNLHASSFLRSDANSSLSSGYTLSIGGTASFSALTASRPLKLNAANQVTSGLIDISSASDVTGTLPITFGGTGTGTTPASGQLLIGTSTGAYSLSTLSAGASIGITNASGSITITHADTSSQASSDNSTTTVIQDITLDGLGHIIGIGTTNLSGQFEVPLTFTNGLTRATNTVSLGGTLTGLTKIDLSGNTFGFFGTGNVGIGNTNPTQKLDVTGSLNVSGTGIFTTTKVGGLQDTANSLGSTGNLLVSTGTGVSWVPTTSLSIGNADTVDNLHASSFLRSDANSSLSSGYTLSIGGTASFSALTASRPLKLNAANQVTSGLIDISSASDVTGTLPITFGGTGTGTTPASGRLLIGTSTGSYSLSTLSAGSNIGITSGSGVITIHNTQTLSGLGGISGSGTNNYLTKWQTAGSTIINSQLLDDGTNVGIGTTSLGTAKFSVMGGNVGIGTTSVAAGYLLDVSGNLRIGGTGYFANWVGIGITSPTALLHLYNPNGTYGAGSRLVFGDDYYNVGSPPYTLNTYIAEFDWQNNGDTDQLEIHGKYGIFFTTDGDGGTSDLDYAMAVLGDGAGYRIGMGNTDPQATLHVLYSGITNDIFRLDETLNDSTPFLVDGWGNVGIGTSGPKYKLEVSGSGLLTTLGVGATSASYAFNVSTNANIGTNLNVGGTGIFTTTKVGGLQDTANSLGSTGNLLVSTGTGVSWVPTTSLSIGNADTVDNLHAASFLRSDANSTLTAGNTLTLSGNLSVGGTASFSALTASRPLKLNAANQVTSGLIDISSGSDVTGTLPVAFGGTGTGTTPSSGQLLIGTSTGSYSLSTLSAGSNIGITSGSGVITIHNTQTLSGLGGISGSGTNNYLTKWQTAGSTIINSQLLDDGTNVGIGTSVLGTAKFSVMGGNVGIGTTSPVSGYRLDVSGNLNLSNTGSLNVGGSANIVGSATVGTSLSVGATGTFTGSVAVNGGNLTSSSSTFNLFNAGVTTLNIGGAASSLNLGVNPGRVAVAGTLSVGTSANITNNLSVGGSGSITSTLSLGSLLSVNNGIGASGQILMSNAGTRGPEWATVSIGGGTYTASNGLYMSGNDIRLGGTLSESTTITQGNNLLLINNNGSANTRINLSSTGDFIVEDAGVPVLYVDDSGNVGIGTSTPLSKLELVNGNIKIGGTSSASYPSLIAIQATLDPNEGLDTYAITMAYLSVGTGSKNITNLYGINIPANGWVKGTSGTITNAYAAHLLAPTIASNNYALYTSGRTVLAGTSGNVGIGATTPNALLHLYQSNQTTAAYGIQFGTDTNLYRSATDTLKTDDNLSVGSSASITSTLSLGSLLSVNNGIGASGQILMSNAGTRGPEWATVSALGGVTGSGIQNYHAKWTGTSTLGNSLILDDGTNVGIGTSVLGTAKFSVMGGNVGIGTTSPSYLLHVNGAGLLTALGVGATSPSYAFNVSTNANIGTSANIGSSLTVGGNLSVTGASTLTGNVGIGGTLNMNNQPILNIGNAGTDFDGTGGLTLAGNLRLNSNQILNSSGTATIILSSTPTTTYNTLNAGAWQVANATATSLAALSVYQQQSGPIFLAETTDGAKQFIIKNDGNVGLGTTNPTSLLHLASTSTSTSFTGFNLNWNPGSTTTLTGDLFSLNIGSSANVSNIFNILDAGSSLFSVSETAMTSNQPANFTSSGDVAVAYDLNFTNPTASYIKSAAPLYVQAGETFNSSNLTLRTFNSGNLIIESANIWADGTNVGIGTTNPVQKLHVEGNCITGDSLLYTVPTNSNTGQEVQSSEFRVQKVQIKDVKPKTEVYSLNEETGKLEPHKINKLLDMGVKPVFKLKTESGKEIRTTGNHPYLVQLTDDEYQRRIQLRETGSLEESYGLGQGSLSESYEFSKIRELWTNGSTKKSSNLDTSEYSGRQWEIREQGIYPVSVSSSGQSIRNSGLSEAGGGTQIFDTSTSGSVDSTNLRNQGNAVGTDQLSEKAIWSKVIYLSPGDLIAIFSLNSEPLNPEHVVWDKIQSIEYVGEEQVYDIEVEGTHNFVANGILAHNTYISGNVGIGTTSPNESKLHIHNTVNTVYDQTVGSFRMLSLRNESATAGTATGIEFRVNAGTIGLAGIAGISAGGYGADLGFITRTIAGNQTEKMRITSEGNVGIGTTSPGAKLEIRGAAASSPTISVGTVTANKFMTLAYNEDGSNAYGSFSMGTSSTEAFTFWNRESGSALALKVRNSGGSYNSMSFYHNDIDGVITTTAGDIALMPAANVGIGTTAPAQKLAVVGSSGTASGVGVLSVLAGTQELRIGGVSSSHSWIQSYGNLPLSLNPIGNNVGIGTTAPGYKLDVVYSSNNSAWVHPSSTGSYIGLNTNAENFLNFVNSGLTSGARYWRLGTRTGTGDKLVIERLNDAGSSITSTPFVLDSNGNVGIGTTGPLTTLELASGNLAAVNAGYATGDPNLTSRFDGPQPYHSDNTGNPHSELGQFGTTAGGAIHRPGKFGKGIQIAVATTNIAGFTNPSAEFGVYGWQQGWCAGGNSVTSTQISTDSVYGNYSVRQEKAGTGGCSTQAGFRVQSPCQTASAGNSYTASLYYKAETAGSVYLSMTFFDASWGQTGTANSSSWNTTVDGVWRKSTVTGTAPATTTRVCAGPYYTGAQTWLVDAGQLEQTSSATPFCDSTLGTGHAGGLTDSGTRTAASLYYANPINRSAGRQGSVSLWWKSSAGSDTAVDNYFFDEGNIKAYYKASDDKIYFTDGTNTISTSALSLTAETNYHLAFTWSSSGLNVYINGVNYATGGTYTAPTLGANLYIGSNTSSASQANGVIDDFAVFNTALSAQEVYSIYKSGAPLQLETQPSILGIQQVGIGVSSQSSLVRLAVGGEQDKGFVQLLPQSAANIYTYSAITSIGEGALLVAPSYATSGNSHLWFVNKGGIGTGAINITALDLWQTTSSFGYGNIAYIAGNVGIGTTDPKQAFQVGTVGVGNTGNFFQVDSTGNVGIGTSVSTTHRIAVRGTAGLTTGTTWTSISDAKFKNIQGDLKGSALEKIMALHPISYNWNSAYNERYGENPGLKYGFIAQEIKEAIPEFVTQDEGGYYWYNPSGIESILTAAIQEQQNQISHLSSQLGQLNLTSSGDLVLETSGATYDGLLAGDFDSAAVAIRNTQYAIRNITGETIDRVLAGTEGIFARIKTGFAETTNLLAENILTRRLRVEEKIVSPVIETDEIQFKSQNAKVKSTSQNSKILITDYTDATTMEIDTENKTVTTFGDLLVEGNVGIGATLSTQDLEVQGNATFSGELYAESARIKKLRAESIEGLEAYIATLAAQSSISSPSSLPTPDSLPTSPNSSSSGSLADLSANWPITDPSNDIKVEGSLTIYGITTLAQTIIAGPISQDGTLLIDEGNSINVLGSTLYLQNKGMGGIDLLAGKVTIDTLGNAVFEGNLTVKGVLFAGLIRPPEGKDLVFDLSNLSEGATGAGSVGFGKLLARGENGETVFSLDASGSAEFKGDLAASSFKVAREVIAAEPDFNGIIQATSSAGIAKIPANATEVTIKSPFVSEKSLIYLTPIGSTKNQVLYLARTKPLEKTFTVGIDAIQTKELRFNWWIVN